ncbi:hypothetical protein H4Q26_009394 [Puccinia striiformis f. sp. tritici PST-130]|nr:hypothetical protein H4Q26_009394 [Puccinia striiformis f. sp. tritici PST-130]
MFNLIRTRTQTNLSGRAYLHVTSHLQAIAPLRMPALSPTMEAGQISKWNIKTGERFSAGIRRVIAVLGDHSDDVKGTVNVPLEWNSSNNPRTSINDQDDLTTKSRVNRLLHDLGVKDATKIKGTGLRGRLTKGTY